MSKKISLIYLVIVLILIASHSQAQVYYSKILENAENYNHIDPIKDSTNQLIGFVYTDIPNKKFEISYIYNDSVIDLSLNSDPVKTINYMSGDTLFLYGVVIHYIESLYHTDRPLIHYYKIYNNQIEMDSIQPMPFIGPAYVGESLTSVDISFNFLENSIKGIIFNILLRINSYHETLGISVDDIPTSFYYSLDLETEILRKSATLLEPSILNSYDTIGYAAYKYNASYYDFRDFPEETNFGYDTSASFWVRPNLNLDLFYLNNENNFILKSIFADNFRTETDFDEVIYHGNLYDLSADSQMQVGCFEVLDSTSNLLWYTPVDGITLDFIYHPFHAIAGRNSSNAMILLDYRNGQIELSHSFQRELDKFQYFETGTDQPFINALGVHGDTLFVYRFDTPTDIVEYGLENNEIPKSFEIKQNFPNPFNAATSITFANKVYQHIELSIYNILGQEIKTLVSANLSPGDHIYNWDGLDEEGHDLPSGIYFARLATEENSDLIKMVMLK